MLQHSQSNILLTPEQLLGWETTEMELHLQNHFRPIWQMLARLLQGCFLPEIPACSHGQVSDSQNNISTGAKDSAHFVGVSILKCPTCEFLHLHILKTEMHIKLCHGPSTFAGPRRWDWLTGLVLVLSCWFFLWHFLHEHLHHPIHCFVSKCLVPSGAWVLKKRRDHTRSIRQKPCSCTYTLKTCNTYLIPGILVLFETFHSNWLHHHSITNSDW